MAGDVLDGDASSGGPGARRPSCGRSAETLRHGAGRRLLLLLAFWQTSDVFLQTANVRNILDPDLRRRRRGDRRDAS